MSFDIYGNNLRKGYCEVHPNVHEEYPCSLCYAERQNKRERHSSQEPTESDFKEEELRQQLTDKDNLIKELVTMLKNCQDRLADGKISGPSFFAKLDALISKAIKQP